MFGFNWVERKLATSRTGAARRVGWNVWRRDCLVLADETSRRAPARSFRFRRRQACGVGLKRKGGGGRENFDSYNNAKRRGGEIYLSPCAILSWPFLASTRNVVRLCTHALTASHSNHPFTSRPYACVDVQVLAQGSGSSVDWLVEKFGLDLSLVSQLGAFDLPPGKKFFSQ